MLPPTFKLSTGSSDTHGCILGITNQSLYEFKQNNLHLLDGIAGDNQCHIAALEIVSLANKHMQGLLDLNIKTGDLLNPVAKYLALQLICSSSMLNLNKKHLLVKRIWNTRRIAGNNHITLKHKSLLQNFLQNPEIISHIKQLLCEMNVEIIKKKITELALQNESLSADLMLLALKNNLGKYLTSELFLQNPIITTIPIICKIKILCNHGIKYVTIIYKNGIPHMDHEPASADEPVIVIEAISSSNTKIRSFDTFNSMRSECCNNLFHIKERDRHHTCSACIQCNNCAHLNHEHILKLPFEIIMRRIAASFMNTLQPKQTKELLDQNSPLANNFKLDLQKSDDEGLSSTNISTLFIEHMHPSIFSKAIQSKRLVDSTNEELFAGL